MSGVVNRKRLSGAGPPKRRERDEATVEQQMVTTTVYAISKTPFRAVVFLPTLETRLTTEAVKAAFAEQFPDRAFPTLPQGHFEVVWSNQQGQVALFWHKKVKGCRKTGSTHHGHLPRPIVRHTERHNITCEPSLRVGFEYLFGYSHAYTITEEREIKLSQQFPPGLVKKRTEPQRTMSMVSTLKKQFTRANVTLDAFSRNSSHFCPFSGGGDIQVFQTAGSTAGHPTAAVVMTGQEDEEEPEPVNSPDLTPPKAHEGRCGSVENKITGPQTEREALLQLQADMVLTCATLLEERLSSPSSTPELFDTLVCYGVLLGVPYPLKLLKLTIDFVKEDMVFEERFSLNVCLFSPIYIDLVLHYVFQSVDCK